MKHPLHLVAAAALAIVGAVGFATIASASTKLSTVEVQLTCGSATACNSFSLEVINGNSVVLNGLTIEVVGQKITHFQLAGYPSDQCKATGVDNAIGCYPISVPPKATLKGTGTSTLRMTSASRVTVYTTVDLFTSSVGQTVLPTASAVTTPTSSTASGATPGTSHGGDGTVVTIGAIVGVLALLAFAYWFLVVRRKGDGGDASSTTTTSTTPVRDCSAAEAEVAAAEAEVAGVRAGSDSHYHDFGDLTYWGEILRASDGSTADYEAEVSIARRTIAAHQRLDRANEVLKACREGRDPVFPPADAKPFDPVPPSSSSDDSEGPRQEIG